MTEKDGNTPEKLERIKEVFIQRRETYRKTAKTWRIGYRTLVIASVACSAFATMLANSAWTGTAALLAGLAGICTTVIGTLEFEQNWKANRRARHRTDLLVIDMDAGESNVEKLCKGMAEIINEALENDHGED